MPPAPPKFRASEKSEKWSLPVVAAVKQGTLTASIHGRTAPRSPVGSRAFSRVSLSGTARSWVDNVSIQKTTSRAWAGRTPTSETRGVAGSVCASSR